MLFIMCFRLEQLLKSQPGHDLLVEDQGHQTETASQADDTKEQLHQPLENRTAAAFFSPTSIVICDNDMAGKDGFEAAVDQEKAEDRDQQTAAAHFQDLAQVSLPDRDLVGGDVVERNQRDAGDDDQPGQTSDHQAEQAGTRIG